MLKTPEDVAFLAPPSAAYSSRSAWSLRRDSPMQVQIHTRKAFSLVVGIFFLFLFWIIFLRDDDYLSSDITVSLDDLVSYGLLATHMGGAAVVGVHRTNLLDAHAKGLTDEGKQELLTKADLISNYLILDVLKRITGLKIYSEEKTDGLVGEKDAEPFRQDRARMAETFGPILQWLPRRRFPLRDLQVWIDPLDATQEYTEGLTQYVTVMACVALEGKPIVGIIHRPFHNETFVGVTGHGVSDALGRSITRPKSPEETIVVSRSHAGQVSELAKKAFGSTFTIEAAGGSGYKSLRVLNGSASIYIHRTAIKLWDTCAGDAIIHAAGGAMTTLDGADLDYSKGTADGIINTRGLFASVHQPYTFLRKLRPFVQS